jgi:hypothetical protein
VIASSCLSVHTEQLAYCWKDLHEIFYWVYLLNFNVHGSVQRSNILIYRVPQEEGTKLREGVPYVKLYRKTPKHLYPKLNGLGDNGK